MIQILTLISSVFLFFCLWIYGLSVIKLVYFDLRFISPGPMWQRYRDRHLVQVLFHFKLARLQELNFFVTFAVFHLFFRTDHGQH